MPYKPTKQEIYEAIGAALSDNASSTSPAKGLDCYNEVAKENPNWAPIKPSKFKKYQKRVVQARNEGIAPAAILANDDASVSTIGSMASRARNFISNRGNKSSTGGGTGDDGSTIVSTTSSTLDNMSTSFKKKLGALKRGGKKKGADASGGGGGGIPGSISANNATQMFSSSPLREDPDKEVQYSVIASILPEGETDTAQTSPDENSSGEGELDLKETLNAQKVVVDKAQEGDDATDGVYSDDNDGKKGKDCCAQGCSIM